MGRTQNKQAGFNIVELLVIIVAVGVIGVGGWFIYQHNRTQLANASSNGQPTTQTTTQNTQTGATLDIKEWGVHMTLDSTTASMYYYMDPSNPNVAYISLHDVTGISPECAADKVSLGAMVRETPAQQQSAPNAQFDIKGTIQIGNYWYGFAHSPAVCIATAAQDAAVRQKLPEYSIQKLIDTFNTLASD